VFGESYLKLFRVRKLVQYLTCPISCIMIHGYEIYSILFNMTLIYNLINNRISHLGPGSASDVFLNTCVIY
jgi:hypothetical protein